MVIELDNGKFAKDCPCCGEQQTYTNRYYALASERLGKVCKKCSNRNPEKSGHMGFYKGVLRASFAHKYKSGAETREIEWGVTFDYLADLLIEQDFKCALTGDPLDAMEVSNNCSLDRIDNSKGYIEGNVQWVTGIVNICKQSYPQEDFIEMCRKVANWS